MAECGLSMLSALAEEVANLDGGRRKELVAATQPLWDQVVGAAQQLAGSAGGTPGKRRLPRRHNCVPCSCQRACP